MKTINTDKENVFRDVESKVLLIVDENERNKIKQQRKLIDRINTLENSVTEIHKTLDIILNRLKKTNEPRTY